MKRPAQGFCALFFFFLLISLTSISYPQPLYDLLNRRAVLIGTGLDQPYFLPDTLLIENSETLTMNDSLLHPDIDYRLDYIRGIIKFNETLAITDTVKAVYQVFPFNLRISYFSPVITIKPEEVAQVDTIQPPPSFSEAEMFDIGSLRKSGTLVRGITIGSDRDLSVESGLDLRVEGRLGKDVDVLALLSDQNTPIQPEGNTATLQEIDRVLIQVQSTHFAATLGDYELQFDGPRFGTYYRKLQGAQLEGRTIDDRLTLSGAVSKGQYHTNYFSGEEGNQGPYRLTDKEGRQGILVLAGTERIWLDGERLQRGENNDYTIEYGLGEIIFTPRRLMTSDSRITVDFQYSAEVYGRDIYAVQGEGRFSNDKFGLRTTLISESDARNNPLSFVLTDSSRAALESAGDNPALAQIYQVETVGVGEGTYKDSTITFNGQDYNIFVYTGQDTDGYLNIVFSYVGTNQGDYSREASATGFYYVWIGPGQGSYAPVQRLPLPERKRLADVEVWGNPTETLQFKLEGAISELDRNTMSEQDDNDNFGTAWAADGHWQSSAVKAAGDFSKVGLDAHVRNVDAQFSEIDRFQQVEYSRQWDLDEEASVEETVGEVALNLQPISPWKSSIEYGYLNKEKDGFQSERWGGKTEINKKKLPQVKAEANWIRSNSEIIGRKGFWTRGQSSTSYQLWRFTPNVLYEREHKRDDYADSLGGFLFNRYNAGLNYDISSIHLETSQELREDQRYYENKLKNFSQARTGNYKAGLSNWHNLFGDALYTHRTKDYSLPDSARSRSEVMEVNLGWTPWKRSVDLLTHYRLSNTRVSTIVQTPIEVGPGQGTHTKVGDLFFEDPDGEYILITQSTGQFQPVVDLEGSIALELDPSKLPQKTLERFPSPWRHLSSQTLLNFTEKTKERDIWALYRLDFSKFQGDSTLQGNFLLREDLFLFRQRRDLSFRLRGELSQSLSNLYLSGGQESKRKYLSFRVRRSFSQPWSVQTEIGRESEIRTYRTTNASSRDITAWELAVEPVYKPNLNWEIGASVSGKWDIDRVENIKADRYGVEPRLIRNFTQKGRAELRLAWFHVATEAQTLPYELAEGDPPGDNFRWDFRLDYRISKYLTATLSYNGNKEADREAIHIGRAEVRAFF